MFYDKSIHSHYERRYSYVKLSTQLGELETPNKERNFSKHISFVRASCDLTKCTDLSNIALFLLLLNSGEDICFFHLMMFSGGKESTFVL